MTSSSSIIQTIQVLDTVKYIGSKSWPDTQDRFYAILPDEYRPLLSVQPTIGNELLHFLRQPLSMTKARVPDVRTICLDHDGTTAGDDKVIAWFQIWKLMETFTPLFVRYNLLDSQGIRYFVKYRFSRRLLVKIVSGDGDCGTEWCLERAKWALETSLCLRLRATHESVLARWFVHIHDSQIKHHTMGPSKHEGTT